MAKWLKVMFIVSVLLNLVLIIGAFWARSQIRSTQFELAALSAEAEAKSAELVLTELESDNPARIDALKTRLKQNIEQAERVAAIWRSAAQR